MADEDIYGSKQRYESFVSSYKKTFKRKPTKKNWKSRYYCKNKQNLAYFEPLIKKCEARDNSYIRRLKLIAVMKLVTYVAKKKLSQLEPEDIDEIIIFMRTRYKKVTAQADFIKDLKCIWKWLFPELDGRGHADPRLIPWSVRHLDAKIDPSKIMRRNNKIYPNDLQKLVNYFSDNKSVKAYLLHATESKARPQELMSLRLKHVTIIDNYAQIFIDEHKKEIGGMAKCFESFPAVLEWYRVHPLKHDPESYFYLNENNAQLTPPNLNKMLRIACKKLGIPNITTYGLKHSGVSWDILKGKPVTEIQSDARWTSLRQLQTYNQVTQEDYLIMKAIKRGDIKDSKVIEKYKPFLNPSEDKPKSCPICENIIGNDEICPYCKHPTDRDKIKQEIDNASRMVQQIKELTARQEKYEAVLEMLAKRKN